jgi:hypothetical protein
MFYSPTKDPLKWRHRAEEARTMAEDFTDQDAKQTMLRIAEAYEEIARRAEGKEEAKQGIINEPLDRFRGGPRPLS